MKTHTLRKVALHLAILTTCSILAHAKETNGEMLDNETIVDQELEYGINGDGRTLYVAGANGWPSNRWVGDLEIPEAVNVDGVRMPVTVIGNSAFYGGYYSLNITGKITIPEGIVLIGNSSFAENETSEIILPESLQLIDESAFMGCKNITSVRIPSLVTVINSYAFSDCSLLTNVIFHDNITTIGEGAFKDCAELLNPAFPSNLREIQSSAFEGCLSLTSLTFPENLKSIGYSSFSECRALQSVILPSSLSSFSQYSFNSCMVLQTVTFRGPLPDKLPSYIDYSNIIGNGENPQLITIICKPNIGFEEAFSDTDQYKILYSSPYAIFENKSGSLIPNASKVNFGIVKTGRKGSTISLRLKNAGSMPLKLGKANLRGRQSNSFAVISKMPRLVAAGKSITIKVRFTPQTTKTLSSSLEIKCNDPTKKILKLRLTGKGK